MKRIIPARSGFSLIEMLVVVGIIAVLTGASLGGYNAFVKRASRARCVELVANVKTALEAVHQKEGCWPRAVLAGADKGELTKEVGAALAKRNALSLSYDKVERDGASVYELTGNDRFGIVSPWAMDVIKRNASATESTKVPSGGTIADHRLHYAIDTDDNGIVEVNDLRVKVRAKACVWCYGTAKTTGSKAAVKSWSSEQEVR